MWSGGGAAAAGGGGGGAAAGGGGAGGAAGALAALQGNPGAMQQLSQLMASGDSGVQQALQQLFASNPQMAQALAADPEGMLAALRGDGAGGEEVRSFHAVRARFASLRMVAISFI